MNTTIDRPFVGQAFLLAGRAVCTLTTAQGRWTYRITRKDDGVRPPVYFVSVLTGPNNERDYTYLGVFDPDSGSVRVTAKSAYTPESPVVSCLNLAGQSIWSRGRLPLGFELHHEGRCGRCGRTLTVPESIATGLGPECATKGRG